MNTPHGSIDSECSIRTAPVEWARILIDINLIPNWVREQLQEYLEHLKNPDVKKDSIIEEIIETILNSVTAMSVVHKWIDDRCHP